MFCGFHGVLGSSYQVATEVSGYEIYSTYRDHLGWINPGFFVKQYKTSGLQRIDSCYYRALLVLTIRCLSFWLHLKYSALPSSFQRSGHGHQSDPNVRDMKGGPRNHMRVIVIANIRGTIKSRSSRIYVAESERLWITQVDI